MELSTAIAFPVNTPATRSSRNTDSRRDQEEMAREPVSFPSLLQESHRTEKPEPQQGSRQKSSGAELNSSENPESQAKGETTAGKEPVVQMGSSGPTQVQSLTSAVVDQTNIKATDPAVAASPSDSRGLFLGESPLLSGLDLKSGSGETVVETAQVLPTETTAESSGPALVMDQVTGEGQPATPDSSVQTPVAESAPESAAVKTELSTGDQILPVEAIKPDALNVQPAGPVAGPEVSQPMADKTVMPETGPAPEAADEQPSALVKDEKLLAKPAPKMGEVKIDKAPVEEVEVQVVEDEAASEGDEAPVEAAVKISSQGAADLDQLAQQVKAQKGYQPATTVSAESQASVKPTLADLDLGSGSFASPDQEDSLAAKLLSQQNSAAGSVRKNVRGQVLSRVVENLHSEMAKEKLTIRLNPEELGQVEIQFFTQDDQLKIVMTAQGQEAEKALQEGSRDLADSISEKSARFNLVDVRIETRGQQDQPKQDTRQDERKDKDENQGRQEQQQRQPNQNHHPQTGAGEWAAFHLGG